MVLDARPCLSAFWDTGFLAGCGDIFGGSPVLGEHVGRGWRVDWRPKSLSGLEKMFLEYWGRQGKALGANFLCVNLR